MSDRPRRPPAKKHPSTRISAEALRLAKRIAREQDRAVVRVLGDAVTHYIQNGSPMLDPRKLRQVAA